MALTFDFEEEFKTSRAISITDDGFDQDFVFFICGNFLDEADIDEDYGPDDDIQALNAAYSMIPPFRMMPTYDGNIITLTLNKISVEQIGHDDWIVRCGYGISKTGGQGPGGYNQDVEAYGPQAGDYDKWSNNFVQLGFNVSSQQETKSMSLQVVAIHKNAEFGNQNVPHQVYKPAPIGQTLDGVEGSQVYQRQFSFNITSYFTPQRLNFPYVRRLYRMATTLNLLTFFGFPPLSTIFLEASASGDLFSIVPVTFDFEMRPNFAFINRNVIDPTLVGPPFNTPLTNLGPCDPREDRPLKMYDLVYDPYFNSWPIDDTAPPNFPNKPGLAPGNAPLSGWYDIDYRYAPIPDNVAGMITQKPILRIVHSNYYTADFKWLEL